MSDEHAASQSTTPASNLDRRYPVERIQWIDSSSIQRWEPSETYLDYARDAKLICESVGYVVYESDDRVAVVQNLASREMDNMMVIPKVAIQLRVRLNDE